MKLDEMGHLYPAHMINKPTQGRQLIMSERLAVNEYTYK